MIHKCAAFGQHTREHVTKKSIHLFCSPVSQAISALSPIQVAQLVSFQIYVNNILNKYASNIAAITLHVEWKSGLTGIYPKYNRPAHSRIIMNQIT